MTAAEAGAAVADGWLARWVAAPAVAEVRNPIGAGDALVGGLALALERGEEFAAAVALGMACGAASVETDVAGVVVPARVAALLASGLLSVTSACAYSITEGKRTAAARPRGRPPRGRESSAAMLARRATGHEKCQHRCDKWSSCEQPIAPRFRRSGPAGRRGGLLSLGDAVCAAQRRQRRRQNRHPLTSLSFRG